MHFSEYQSESKKTAIYGDLNINGLLYTTLGLSGEVGEFANKIKKIIRDKNGVIGNEDLKALGLELGDVLWYLSQTATELGLDMNDIAEANIVKLQTRSENKSIQGDGDSR